MSGRSHIVAVRLSEPFDVEHAHHYRCRQSFEVPCEPCQQRTGATRHGIGLTVSGLVRCVGREAGTLIPVSVRVSHDVCASLPCALGPDGASEPLRPAMDGGELAAWERSLAVLRAANEILPI